MAAGNPLCCILRCGHAHIRYNSISCQKQHDLWVTGFNMYNMKFIGNLSTRWYDCVWWWKWWSASLCATRQSLPNLWMQDSECTFVKELDFLFDWENRQNKIFVQQHLSWMCNYKSFNLFFSSVKGGEGQVTPQPVSSDWLLLHWDHQESHFRKLRVFIFLDASSNAKVWKTRNKNLIQSGQLSVLFFFVLPFVCVFFCLYPHNSEFHNAFPNSEVLLIGFRNGRL